VTEPQPDAGDGQPPDAAPSPAHHPDPALHGADDRVRARLTRLEHLLGGHLDEAHLPAWLRPTSGEQRLPVGAAILVAIVLQWAVLKDIVFESGWPLLAAELVLFASLMIANPSRINRESKWLRVLSLTLVLVVSLATVVSLGRLVYELLHGEIRDAPALLLTGGAIWLTNVIVFALWYWETDRGGPAARANARHRYPAFLFPQMTVPEMVDPEWEPNFVDYLYLSFTNSTAFSPTDALPLSRWAKLAMMFQSAVSLAVVVLVVARAVNILR
jgi:uncharacterized membrane protein